LTSFWHILGPWWRFHVSVRKICVFHARRSRDSTVSWLDRVKCCSQISAIKAQPARAAGEPGKRETVLEADVKSRSTAESFSGHKLAEPVAFVRPMLPDAGLPGASSQLFEGKRGIGECCQCACSVEGLDRL